MKRDSRKDPTVEMKCRETFNKFRKHTALSSETLSRGIDKEFPEANTQYKFEPEFENLKKIDKKVKKGVKRQGCIYISIKNYFSNFNPSIGLHDHAILRNG